LKTNIKESTLLDALLLYVFTDVSQEDIDEANYWSNTADLFNDQNVNYGDVVLKNGTIWYFINEEIRIVS